MANVEVTKVGELPKVKRGSRESGVWAERLAPLRDEPMEWFQVYGPTKNPHAVIANVQNGGVAGVDDVDRFEFAGRVLDTETVTDPETGETEEVPQGYVFARLMNDERYAERTAEIAEKRKNRKPRKQTAKKGSKDAA